MPQTSSAPIPPIQCVSWPIDFGRSFNGYADILGVHDGSLLVADLGGSAMTSRLRLVDLAGLAERRIAGVCIRDNDRAALRDYVFEVVKPTFIQSTYSRVAISTCSTVRHGPRGLISSVLNSPITVSARALS